MTVRHDGDTKVEVKVAGDDRDWWQATCECGQTMVSLSHVDLLAGVKRHFKEPPPIDEREALLRDALQALKDIVNAADNGEPYSIDEMLSPDDWTFVGGVLGRAYKMGIRLDGEE